MSEHGENAKTTDPPQGHSRWLAHHFDTPQQQLASAKLGMWIFLVTEVLFFGGLFCAYAVYRRNHPEIFIDGHHFLDTNLGAINTVVLIFSSFTMAWGVRCAQLSRRTGLVICLAITLLCAGVFLGIKYYEYYHKWEHRLFPGQDRIVALFSSETLSRIGYSLTPSFLRGKDSAEPPPLPPREFEPDLHYVKKELERAGQTGLTADELHTRAKNLTTFFGIYFGMTGLHALHVIAGIIAITWILIRSLKGHFSSTYYDPVDCVGLYWHLVDLIWIYLFPLLYLIH